jgi:TRAP-type C4-dicarboxylate transport system permease small subunit
MALMVAMVALVTLGVFFRYVVDASLSWYDEFASYLLVWLSFYGAVVATWRGRHISFDTLVERAGPRGRRVFQVVSEGGSLLFQVVLFAYGIVLVRAVGHETAVSIQAVPMGLIYSVLPISGGLMLLVTLVRLGRLLGGQPATPDAPPSVPVTGTE